MPPMWFKVKGDLNSLSVLSMLAPDAQFEIIKSKENHHSPHVARSALSSGGFFKLKGDISLVEDGRIDWDNSFVDTLLFEDPNNGLSDFKIVDEALAYGFLKELIESNSGNYPALLFDNGFEYRGTKRNDNLDISNLSIENLAVFPWVLGGAGADSITGSDANDFLAASASREICRFGSGTDLLKRVKDVLVGGDGVDSFYVDNGTKIVDIEVGEKMHLYVGYFADSSGLADETPLFKYKSNKTVIKVGSIRMITNPMRFDYVYQEPDICDGDLCTWYPVSEGYVFTAAEAL